MNKSGFKSGEEWKGNAFGRPKGSKNKSGAQIRQAYQDLLEGNLDKISGWLAQVAKEDPSKAFDMLMKLSNFVIPKLTQSDITSDGEPINIILPKPKDEQ